MQPIYLDSNASTPIAPEVADAMRPYLTKHYGNPSSTHWAGKPAREAVDRARAQVAQLLGCLPGEVVFTSGGTEANNFAIKGAYYALREKGNHIITSAIEHPATLKPCEFLRKHGAEITILPVDSSGRVNPVDVEKAVTDATILITIMHANNETGVIQPIESIGEIAKARGVWFHTDAAQSVGKLATRVDDLGVDMLSVAGHKVYAPKGVGALYIRLGVEPEPFVHGAAHEFGRRAGTENVLLDVGLGAACELAAGWVGMPGVRELRDHFWSGLRETFGDRVVLNGHPEHRLPNTLNVSFPGREGAAILDKLEGVAASTGAACHAGAVTLSPVLEAMGIPQQVGMGAIRFSLGRDTTRDEIDAVLTLLEKISIQVGVLNP
jgi:cysteine desulfurase